MARAEQQELTTLGGRLRRHFVEPGALRGRARLQPRPRRPCTALGAGTRGERSHRVTRVGPEPSTRSDRRHRDVGPVQPRRKPRSAPCRAAGRRPPSGRLLSRRGPPASIALIVNRSAMSDPLAAELVTRLRREIARLRNARFDSGGLLLAVYRDTPLFPTNSADRTRPVNRERFFISRATAVHRSDRARN